MHILFRYKDVSTDNCRLDGKILKCRTPEFRKWKYEIKIKHAKQMYTE